MRLIGLAVVLAVGLGLVPFAADSQTTGKVYRSAFCTLPMVLGCDCKAS
jgi:hypothetical protein